MSTETVYITGPITGLPGGNRSEFDACAKWLRENTTFKKVISPVEEDTPEEFAATMAQHYGDVYWSRMLADFDMVMRSDALVLLPGWERSRGARMEIFIALSRDKKFYGWDVAPDGVWFSEVTRELVRDILSRNMP